MTSREQSRKRELSGEQEIVDSKRVKGSSRAEYIGEPTMGEAGGTTPNSAERESVNDCMNRLSADFTHKLEQFSMNMQTSMTESIQKAVTEVVSREIQKVREEFDKKLKEMQDQVKEVDKKYSDVVKGSMQDDDMALNVVIKRLPLVQNEDKDARLTVNNVVGLVKDGLKVKDVKIVRAERKKGRDGKPGVIIARLASKEQKAKLMSAKASLAGHAKYGKVWIENDTSLEVRIQRTNIQTMLKACGKDKEYQFKGSRLLPKVQHHH